MLTITSSFNLERTIIFEHTTCTDVCKKCIEFIIDFTFPICVFFRMEIFICLSSETKNTLNWSKIISFISWFVTNCLSSNLNLQMVPGYNILSHLTQPTMYLSNIAQVNTVNQLYARFAIRKIFTSKCQHEFVTSIDKPFWQYILPDRLLG